MEILKNKNKEYILENDYIDSKMSFDNKKEKIKIK
jgi:hypothetical protein